MSDNNLDIYLLNTPQPGVERATLVRNLATTFKKEVPVIEKMLRKPRSLLKANVDPATAAKYKNAILKAGGKCELVAHGEDLFPSDALNPVEPRPVLTVAPFEATSLAPAVDPAPTEDEPVHSADNNGASPYSAPATNAQQEKEYFCYNCGRLIAVGWDNCPYCQAQQVQLKSKDKATAGVLAFFLGGFGIHRFYLGQWWGIFYLLFWVTLIPSIVSFIEAFVFWCTSKQNWQNKYGHVPAASTGFKVAIGAACVVAFFFVVGILAAVSLPAYQDYTARSKVHQGLSLVNQTRDKVSAVIQKKKFYPTENVLAGLPENISNEFVSSITLDEGAQMTVKFRIPHLEQRNQNSIIWTPVEEGGAITWNCLGGSMPDKYRVMECRGGSGAINVQPSTNKSLQNIRIYSDDKGVSLMVPDNWKGNRTLNEAAILGVANPASEVYAIVIDEAKSDFDSPLSLSEYLDLHISNMEVTLKDFRQVGPARSLQINNLPARQQVVSGVAENLKITYLLTTVETDTYLYIIYTWTLSSLFEKNQPLLNKVSTSFSAHTGGE
jgi:TM2 domain-containing membrane protein YozV